MGHERQASDIRGAAAIRYETKIGGGPWIGVDLASGPDELAVAQFEDGRITAVFRGEEAAALIDGVAT